MNIFGLGKTRTFRPKKKGKVKQDGASGPDMEEFSLTQLRGNLRNLVKLPEGESLNEWLAVHTLDFFNLTNVFYSTLTEFCTDELCPVMSAGPMFEYWWREDANSKAVQVSAPVYIENLYAWIQPQLNDPSVFPSDIESKFPANFADVVKKICSRLFRVFGHIYHSHLTHVQALDQEPHLNTLFLHFCFFIEEFRLVNKKELEALTDVIARLKANEAEGSEW